MVILFYPIILMTKVANRLQQRHINYNRLQHFLLSEGLVDNIRYQQISRYQYILSSKANENTSKKKKKSQWRNMATFYRFKSLMLSEHLCSKTITKPVCNGKAAAPGLPHQYYKEFRVESFQLFQCLEGNIMVLCQNSSVRAGVQDQRTVGRNAGFSLVDILCNRSKRMCACLPDQTFQH